MLLSGNAATTGASMTGATTSGVAVSITGASGVVGVLAHAVDAASSESSSIRVRSGYPRGCDGVPPSAPGTSPLSASADESGDGAGGLMLWRCSM